MYIYQGDQLFIFTLPSSPPSTIDTSSAVITTVPSGSLLRRPNANMKNRTIDPLDSQNGIDVMVMAPKNAQRNTTTIQPRKKGFENTTALVQIGKESGRESVCLP